MSKNESPACGVMMYLILAIVAISISFVFVKAIHHPGAAQPRAPLHDAK